MNSEHMPSPDRSDETPVRQIQAVYTAAVERLSRHDKDGATKLLADARALHAALAPEMPEDEREAHESFIEDFDQLQSDIDGFGKPVEE